MNLGELDHLYNRVTVYAVDDDSKYLELFRISAARFNSLVIKTFETAKSFQDELSRGVITPHLLFFLDIRLGPVRGFELARRIRETEICSNASIIIMSSSLLQSDIDEAAKCGANSYFHKPTGTSARVQGIQRQLTYWLDDVKLPSTGLDSKPDPVKETKVKPSTVRQRGKPLYALDKLRQDVLVNLLRDIGNLNGREISPATLDKIQVALTRFQEIFEFRRDSFNPAVIEEVNSLVLNLGDWAKVSKSTATEVEEKLEQQKSYWQLAKKNRENLGKMLHSINLKDGWDGKLHRLDTWIWDVFNELGDSPLFPSLYLSLKRFQARAF
jgi:DNA-binding response OmpR family regulator